MFIERKLVAVFSIFVAGWLTLPASAIEVTELTGAAHGYPGLCEANGRKIADGEFRQWVEDHHLYVVITYRLPHGQFFEEKARFRQDGELRQEQWSWKELMHGKPQREFTVDFVSGMASAHIRKDNKDVTEKIDVEAGRTFAGFGFTIALSNLRQQASKGGTARAKGRRLFSLPNA